MNSLFTDLPVSKSPRLLWMERHGIHTTFCAVHDEYFAYKGAQQGRGPTEDDALTALAKAAGLKLWNEEGA